MHDKKRDLLSQTRIITEVYFFEVSSSGSHASVASKETEDLDKLKDVKILLSGLFFGFSILAKARRQRK